MTPQPPPDAPRSRGAWRAIIWAILAALLSACGESVPPSTSPAATFALLYNSANQFCPFAQAHDLTFRIEPYAGEPVVAIMDNGIATHVRWARGFVAGTFDDPVVRDPAGQVVARNGETLLAPPNGFPDLHGYSVCFGGDTIYVLDHTVRF